MRNHPHLVRGIAALAVLFAAQAGFASQSSAQNLNVSQIDGENTIVISNGVRISQRASGNNSNNVVIVDGDNTVVSTTGNSSNITTGSSRSSTFSPTHHIVAAPAIRPSGKPLKGDGNAVTRDYALKGAFDAIALSSPASVAVMEGPVAKVTLTVDQNLQAALAPEVKNGTLYVVAPEKAFRTEQTPVVVVTVPHLTKIRAFNGGMLHLENVHTERLELLAGDGAHMTASGTTRNLRVDASDGAVVNVADLKAGAGDIIATDGANVTGFVTGDLRVHGSEGARINIQGHPSVLSSDNEGGSVSIQ